MRVPPAWTQAGPSQSAACSFAHSWLAGPWLPTWSPSQCTWHTRVHTYARTVVYAHRCIHVCMHTGARSLRTHSGLMHAHRHMCTHRHILGAW